MERKSKPAGYIEPMPKGQLRRIMKAFQKKGGQIIMNEAVDEHLKLQHSEGATFDAQTILLRKNPGRAAVFEELIHSTQFRMGKNNGTPLSILQNEIEAQEKLLRYANAYRLSENEIEQTKRALQSYQIELELLRKEDAKDEGI